MPNIVYLCVSYGSHSKQQQQSRYRSGVAQRVPEKLRFPDFMTTAQDGGKIISLTHRPLFPQEILMVLISVRG